MPTTHVEAPPTDEEKFLRELIVKNFNIQFNTELLIEEYALFSVLANENTDVAYELFSLDGSEYKRIRVYFSFGAIDQINDFTLETNQSYDLNLHNDPLFVATGTLNRVYGETAKYTYQWNSYNNPHDPSIELEDRTGSLQYESGLKILLERQN